MIAATGATPRAWIATPAASHGDPERTGSSSRRLLFRSTAIGDLPEVESKSRPERILPRWPGATRCLANADVHLCMRFKNRDEADGLETGLLEIGQNLGEGVPANVAEHGVVRRICGSPQPELHRPASPPCPGRIINGQ